MEFQQISADEATSVDECLTPSQLLTAFVERRDQEAFARLLQLYGKMVYGVCRRILKDHHDAEDAFQATFVLLARNASSIACRDGITNWLHKVAYHTAIKSKSINTIRKAKEVSMSGVYEPTVVERELWSELEPLLDQELDQLPIKYRMPILLCDIQGKTRKEAARELGCPEATLSTRLLRARGLLAGRLTRQGIVISSAMLVVVTSQNVASASVPASLVASTLNAVSTVGVAHTAGSGTAVTKVISLVKGVYQPVVLGKITLIAVTAIAVLTAAAGMHFRQEEQQSKDEAASSSRSLDEIQRGVEVSFAYLRNHSIAVEHRVDFEYDDPRRDPLAFLWEEQKLVMEESKNKFYARREAIHRQPDHTDPRHTEATSFDGHVRRELNSTKGNNGFMGFTSTGIEKNGGIWLLDRYLEKIGYAFKPRDQKNSKSDPDDLEWLPSCFKKVKYSVAAEQERIDDALCYVVESPGRDKMWIDASHGFVLRKRILKLPKRSGRPVASMEITNTDLEKVSEGLWLPRRSVVERFADVDSGKALKGTRISREILVANSVGVDVPIPAGQYHIEFPVETFVTDIDKQSSYVVKSNGNAVVDQSGNLLPPDSTDAVQSKVSARSSVESLFVNTSNGIRWFGFVNASLLLILGGYFCFRRRSS